MKQKLQGESHQSYSLSETKVTNLGIWLQGSFEEGWQSLESILTARNYDFARSIVRKSLVKKAKKIDFGLLIKGFNIALVISVWPEVNQEVGVLIQVCPMDEHEYLPSGLELQVNLESDSATARAREEDNIIQLEFSELPGRSASVHITLDEAIVTEEFIV